MKKPRSAGNSDVVYVWQRDKGGKTCPSCGVDCEARPCSACYALYIVELEAKRGPIPDHLKRGIA